MTIKRSNQKNSYSVSEFKARALELFESVKQGKKILVTKRGEPIAEIHPIKKDDVTSLFGALKNKVIFLEDIVHVDWSEEWGE